MARGRFLRVYGWGYWGGGCDYRRVMAAHSRKEVLRLNGNPRGGLWNLGETGNAKERAIALAAPLTIFECVSDDRFRDRAEWREVTPRHPAERTVRDGP